MLVFSQKHPITNLISREILERLRPQKWFKNIRHFTDDGYSGVNFNRPGFQFLIAEAEAGNIGTIIVKDMSRCGRRIAKWSIADYCYRPFLL